MTSMGTNSPLDSDEPATTVANAEYRSRNTIRGPYPNSRCVPRVSKCLMASSPETCSSVASSL